MKKQIIIAKASTEFESDILAVADTKAEARQMILDNLDELLEGAYVTFAYRLTEEEAEEKDWDDLLFEIAPDYDPDNYNGGYDEDKNGEYHHYIIPLERVEEIKPSLLLNA